jgi:hypothetical protein
MFAQTFIAGQGRRAAGKKLITALRHPGTVTGKPAFPAAVAALCLLLSAGLLSPGASAAEDMAVKMQWDETLYRDEVSRVVLEITNINTQFTMNVTSAGLYIDWMRLGTFQTNTTSFLLEPNQRKAVNIFFRVPVDARLGKHSDYIVIEYTINNGTNGSWSRGTFESTINKDFSVVERPAETKGRLDISLSNPLSVAGLVAAVIVIAGVAVWRSRRRRRTVEPTPVTRPEPAPELPPPPAPEEKPPREGPEKCPICGAPNPGRHCQNCDWDIG